MTSRPARARLSIGVGLSAVLALALAGCGGSGSSDDDFDPDAKSPLQPYFEAAYGGEFDQKEFDAQQRRQQEAIAACMTEQGFEYIPLTDFGTVTGEPTEVDPYDEEYVGEHGYGIADSMTAAPQEEQPEDPNIAIVEAMSPAESEAYYRALYGEGPTVIEDDPDAEVDTTWDPSQAGCYGSTMSEQDTLAQELSESEEFKPLFEEINTSYEKVEKDARYKDALKAWSACFKEAGQDFTDAFDPQDHLYTKQGELYGEDGVEPSQEALDALREEEVEIALQDLACKKESRLDSVRQEVQFEIEQRIVDEYKAELDAFLARVKEA